MQVADHVNHVLNASGFAGALEVVIAPSLAGDEGALVGRALPGAIPLVVCDDNTFAAMGKRVQQALGSHTGMLVLPKGVKPDMAVVARIRDLLEPYGAVVAVGSGTINDVCKMASFQAGKPYGVFATAASMNGYTSPNASVIEDGYKATRPAHMPRAVWMDAEVIAHAPRRLTQAGFGDVLCRSTVQVDWLLSHLLLDTPYDERPFDWLAPLEETLLAQGVEMETLCAALIVSGLGMAACGGSYPASQGEHMLAHTLEMLCPEVMDASFHGEHIAVTTLAMAEHQAALLSAEAVPRVLHDIPAGALTEAFGESIAQACVAEAEAKYAAARMQLAAQRLHSQWHAFREQLMAMSLPVAPLRGALQAAGCPTTPEALGISSAHWRTARSLARVTRNRFTSLDMA